MHSYSKCSGQVFDSIDLLKSLLNHSKREAHTSCRPSHIRRKRMHKLRFVLPVYVICVLILVLVMLVNRSRSVKSPVGLSVVPPPNPSIDPPRPYPHSLHIVPHLDPSLVRKIRQISSTIGSTSTRMTTPAMPSSEPEVSSDDSEDMSNGNFPPDLFTMDQRRKGAVALHIFGVVYMFIALAVVCDEFFIPALEVITDTLQISEDVAGATFMAAGGSAPELFTSLIGVFISQDDVGVGTIVGSAVFNILFVLSMCALFAKTVLELTWWPLFRDVSFYSFILLTLTIFFADSFIDWWESTVMLVWYGAYVTFMKYNEEIEMAVKKRLYANRVEAEQMPRPNRNSIGSQQNKDNQATQALPAKMSLASQQAIQCHRKMSVPILHGGSSKFRQGVLQLMLNSVDPLHADTNARKNVQSDQSTVKGHHSNSIVPTGPCPHVNPEVDGSSAICVLCLEAQHNRPPASGQLSRANSLAESTGNAGSDSQFGSTATNLGSQTKSPNGTSGIWTANANAVAGNLSEIKRKQSSLPSIQEHLPSAVHATFPEQAKLSVEDVVEPEKPLDISWPKTLNKQVTYLFLFPITILLYFTLPDVRHQNKRKFFVITFVGSIIWIAFFSYLMVWWASVTGSTLGISPEIMGLTFLAAGTSIPDLITSVLVARKGFGDMAVSSSVGSNIFDVAVGLPLPWLLYSIFFQDSVHVNSSNMVFSILLLFVMIVSVIGTIAIFRWRLNTGMAVVMFILYFVFIFVSMLF